MRPGLWTAWATLLLAGAGCGRGESAEERQLAAMREEITRVQADRDRFEQRMTVLETMMADRKAEASPVVAKRGEPVVTPKLRIVRMGPNGVEESDAPAPERRDASSLAPQDDPEDATPRPTLKLNGAAERPGTHHPAAPVPTMRSDGSAQGFTGQLGLTPPPPPSAQDPEAKRAFDGAMALVQAHQPAQALDAFAAFLVKWPDHPSAESAFYYRGESYFTQGEWVHAVDQYEGLLARFPSGAKVPDALLKLGMCHLRLGNRERARFYLEKLVHEHPKSEAAKQIPVEAGPGLRQEGT